MEDDLPACHSGRLFLSTIRTTLSAFYFCIIPVASLSCGLPHLGFKHKPDISETLYCFEDTCLFIWFLIALVFRHCIMEYRKMLFGCWDWHRTNLGRRISTEITSIQWIWLKQICQFVMGALWGSDWCCRFMNIHWRNYWMKMKQKNSQDLQTCICLINELFSTQTRPSCAILVPPITWVKVRKV